MSDGKIYGPVIDGSVDPLERISNLERLWPIIQNRLQVYDKVSDDLQSIKKDIQDIKNVQNQIQDSVADVNQGKDVVEKLLTDHIGGTNNMINDFHNTVSSIIVEMENHKKQVVNKFTEHSSNLHTFKNSMIEETGNFIKSDELLNFKTLTFDSFERLSKDIISLQKKHSEVSQNLLSSQSLITSSKSEVADISQKFVEFCNQVTSLNNNFESLKKYMESQLSKESQKIYQDLEQKISDVKKSFPSSSQALSGLKDEIVKKLEGVALDGTNAVLRSNNSASQIVLLEKKIENILLRLKAVELPK